MIEITINVTDATKDEKVNLEELSIKLINHLFKEVMPFCQNENVPKKISQELGLNKCTLFFQALDKNTNYISDKDFVNFKEIKRRLLNEIDLIKNNSEHYYFLSKKERKFIANELESRFNSLLE